MRKQTQTEGVLAFIVAFMKASFVFEFASSQKRREPGSIFFWNFSRLQRTVFVYGNDLQTTRLILNVADK